MRKHKKDPKVKMMTKIFFIVVILGLSLAILLETIIIVTIARKNRSINKYIRPKSPKIEYCLISNSEDAQYRNGPLRHLHSVLERIGYKKRLSKTKCNLLWFHKPNDIQHNVKKLKPHQIANVFPGAEFLVTEKLLPASEFKNSILPNTMKKSSTHATQQTDSLFLKTRKNHTVINLKNLSEILMGGNANEQEYLRPFLVDGHTFEIGVFVVITSVDPLRAYWYKGDALFRFCPIKFFADDGNPANACSNTSKYLSTWEMPSLSYHYSMLYHGMMDCFDIYARSKHKEPFLMWLEIQTLILELLVEREHHIVAALKDYPTHDNFFEMLRFDITVDENIRVHGIKVKRLPDLFAVKFQPEYSFFYEKLLSNLFFLTGVARNRTITKEKNISKNMASEEQILVFGHECGTICRVDCSALEICQLCLKCITKTFKETLFKAHAENMHKWNFRRLVPPPVHKLEGAHLLPLLLPKDLSIANRLQYLWYQGRCNEDKAWCK